MASKDEPRVSDATRAEETRDAQVAHQPDEAPDAQEEEAAERAAERAPDVSDDYEAAARTGASVKGEGRI